MLIIDPELIRSRLSLEDKDQVNDVLRSAIEGASVSLEAILDTSFSRGSKEDVFFLDRFSLERHGRFHLKLTHGFVRPTPAISCTLGSVYGTYPTTIASSSVILNAEGGVVSIPVEVMDQESYIRIVYDYGFSAQKEVPAWLKEVSLARAVKVLSMNAINDKKNELASVFAFVDTHADTILRNHLRTGSFLISPL